MNNCILCSEKKFKQINCIIFHIYSIDVETYAHWTPTSKWYRLKIIFQWYKLKDGNIYPFVVVVTSKIKLYVYWFSLSVHSTHRHVYLLAQSVWILIVCMIYQHWKRFFAFTQGDSQDWQINYRENITNLLVVYPKIWNWDGIEVSEKFCEFFSKYRFVDFSQTSISVNHSILGTSSNKSPWSMNVTSVCFYIVWSMLCIIGKCYTYQHEMIVIFILHQAG